VEGFVDEAVIEVSSGKGGAGAVSFRREKYVPRGGPDGGDGGKGGDIRFRVRKNLKTLANMKHRRFFRARSGENGKGKRASGKDGDDTLIEIPPGTHIRDFFTHELLGDFTEDGDDRLFIKGGKGGKGNWHFRSSTNQAPMFAQKGEPGIYRKLIVELNLIADVGLIGLPNAGKSTLLSVLTNATPKIAPYPFTTRIPNLGVLRIYGHDIVIADIPGIIKGASSGAGLGLRFLKHVSRTFLLAMLVDLSDESFTNAVDILLNELESFHESLVKKPRIIIATKTDIEGTLENLAVLQKLIDSPILPVSAVTGNGVDELKRALHSSLELDREADAEE
jgi:GTP-binding protein